MTTVLLNDGWSYRKKVSAFSELGGAGAGEWREVVVPHDAMLTGHRRDDLPDGATSGHFPGGAHQYRRNLTASSAHEGRLVWLRFEGVYRNAAVYVNGTLAGQRASGYAEFDVRIDPYLRFGEDNEILVECRTGKDSRWYSGAGIYRNVHLITKELLRVVNVQTATLAVEPDQAIIEIKTLVRNDAMITARARVNTEILSATTGEGVAASGTPVTVLPGEEATIRQRMYIAEPQLWSADAPHLHTVRVDLRGTGADDPSDTEQVTFGIRTVQVDPLHGLRINGETVKLRGACVHHDNGVLGSATFPEAEERRVRILKDAGFNALRSAHNPMSRAMLDACDRLGIYVMDEAFDMWTVSKTDEDYSFDFPTWWERDLDAMVAKDINHPSVLLYSIGNEIPENGTGFGAVQSRKLAEKIRSLDPTRLITNGINGFVAILDEVLAGMRAQGAADPGAGVNTMMAQLGDLMNHIAVSESVTTRTEESQALLDVAGMNYSESRYELDRKLFPQRVIVGSESFPTRIEQVWAAVMANPNVIGDFTWTGWDYLGEAGIGGVDYVDDGAPNQAAIARAYPWLLAYCGDIDITGRRRPASYYREIVFGLRTAPYIAVQPPERHDQTIAFATPWAWSDTVSSWTWPGFEGKPIRVEVYAEADEIALLLDGETIGRQPVGGRKAFCADFETVYRPGSLEAVAYHGGAEIGRQALQSAGAARRLSAEVENGSDRLAFVALSLTDENDIVVTGEDVTLTVELDGPADLQGLGSSNPKTEETFVTNQHATHDGRALAVIRRTGPGIITLTAKSDGGLLLSVDLGSERAASGRETW